MGTEVSAAVDRKSGFIKLGGIVGGGVIIGGMVSGRVGARFGRRR